VLVHRKQQHRLHPPPINHLNTTIKTNQQSKTIFETTIANIVYMQLRFHVPHALSLRFVANNHMLLKRNMTQNNNNKQTTLILIDCIKKNNLPVELIRVATV
jgi:hypothetical protein